MLAARGWLTLHACALTTPHRRSTMRLPPVDHSQYKRTLYLECWNKLRMWEMEQFERLVYMDADMILLRNIDHLFGLPPGFYAVGDCYGGRETGEALPLALGLPAGKAPRQRMQPECAASQPGSMTVVCPHARAQYGRLAAAACCARAVERRVGRRPARGPSRTCPAQRHPRSGSAPRQVARGGRLRRPPVPLTGRLAACRGGARGVLPLHARGQTRLLQRRLVRDGPQVGLLLRLLHRGDGPPAGQPAPRPPLAPAPLPVPQPG